MGTEELTTNCTDVDFDHQDQSPPPQYSESDDDHSEEEEEGGDDNNNENSPKPPVEFSEDELTLITRMFHLVGKRWSLIAGRIPGRSAAEIEEYWTSRFN
ncbi:transcription factor MYB114-like [Impatiens glandulifera]|uniref:transcription factor MYB114-like n=1 Tax=Impatiens glandulifera TaxID=253017 RepID=UPI001FB19E12|nr:transcription factor MYB114-like [Impatiens glandulifera]